MLTISNASPAAVTQLSLISNDRRAAQYNTNTIQTAIKNGGMVQIVDAGNYEVVADNFFTSAAARIVCAPGVYFTIAGVPVALSTLSGYLSTSEGVNVRGLRATVFGDSFSARNVNVGLMYRWLDYGYFTWANMLLNSSFRFTTQYGVSGNTTAQMLARIGPVVADPSDWVFVQGGINDISAGATEATIVANLQAICATLANTKIVCLLAISPNAQAAGNTTKILNINARLRRWCATQKSVIFADVYSALVDSTLTTGAFASGNSPDSLHLSAQGARLAGQVIANAISPFVKVCPFLPSSGAEAWAIDNTCTQLLTSPLMTGTGGSVSGTGASGTLANNWNGGTDTGTVTSVFLAGQSRTDGIGLDQQITISSAGSGSVVNMRQTGVEARCSIGDTLYAVGSITLTGMSDVAYVMPTIQVVMDGTTYQIRCTDTSSTTFSQTNLAFNFRTPEFLLDCTTLSSVGFFLKIGFGTSGTGAAVMKVGRTGLYRIPAGATAS